MRYALTVLLATTALAQTYVVNWSGGPGVDFTSLSTAASSVPDGSVLLVQPGFYGSFTLSGKGLTVLGNPGVVIQGSGIVISNLTAAQRVVLRDLELSHAMHIIVCVDCAGPILLDGIRGLSGTPLSGAHLRLHQCPQAIATRCGWRVGWGVFSLPAIELQSSRLTMIDSSAYGLVGKALDANASDVQLVSCALAAATTNATAALVNTRLRLLGSTSVTNNGTGLAVDGGDLRVAPGVTIIGPTQANTLVPTADENVSSSGGAIGGTVDATMVGVNGSLGFLFIGLPGPARTVPAFVDTWWLDPVVREAVAVAVMSGPVSATINVPANVTLRGEVFGFQGLYLQPTMSFSASSPDWFVLH